MNLCFVGPITWIIQAPFTKIVLAPGPFSQFFIAPQFNSQRSLNSIVFCFYAPCSLAFFHLFSQLPKTLCKGSLVLTPYVRCGACDSCIGHVADPLQVNMCTMLYPAADYNSSKPSFTITPDMTALIRSDIHLARIDRKLCNKGTLLGCFMRTKSWSSIYCFSTQLTLGPNGQL